MSNRKSSRNDVRVRRQARVRKKVRGTTERPRLCVFRSAKHIYAQIIEDINGATLVSASTLQPGNLSLEGNYTGNVNAAKEVGKAVAKMALEKNIERVIFDRNGFLYHGRVQALAEGAREGGLKF
jgi:large subunit ribosomal protein L18